MEWQGLILRPGRVFSPQGQHGFHDPADGSRIQVARAKIPCLTKGRPIVI
jgi:hypothetical protein